MKNGYHLIILEDKGEKNMTEIIEKARKLVEIKELFPEGEERIIYLLQIAEIDIRVYLTYEEANRVANFFRRAIRKILREGIGKIEIVELKTSKIYYLVRIAGFDIKPYLAIEEATRVANYMENVVKKILE